MLVLVEVVTRGASPLITQCSSTVDAQCSVVLADAMTTSGYDCMRELPLLDDAPQMLR